MARERTTPSRVFRVQCRVVSRGCTRAVPWGVAREEGRGCRGRACAVRVVPFACPRFFWVQECAYRCIFEACASTRAGDVGCTWWWWINSWWQQVFSSFFSFLSVHAAGDRMIFLALGSGVCLCVRSGEDVGFGFFRYEGLFVVRGCCLWHSRCARLELKIMVLRSTCVTIVFLMMKLFWPRSCVYSINIVDMRASGEWECCVSYFWEMGAQSLLARVFLLLYEQYCPLTRINGQFDKRTRYTLHSLDHDMYTVYLFFSLYIQKKDTNVFCFAVFLSHGSWR